MDLLSAVTEIVKYLLIFIGAMVVLLVALLVVVSRLSSDNPLKRVLVMLCYRIAATLGAGIIAVPLEPIPGVDVAYDIGATVLLVLYWLSFVASATRAPKVRSKTR